MELKRSQSLTHDSSNNSETNNKNSNENEQFGIVERSKSFSASWAILQTAQTADPKTCQNTMSHETSQQPCPTLQQEQVQSLPLKRNSFGSVTLRRQHTLRGKIVNKYMYTMY